jgi:molybdate/tungstate transport system substrate-binding protein
VTIALAKRTLVAAWVLVLALAAGAAATGGSARANSGSARAANKGSVAVIYAGSLTKYMETGFAPAFEKASGYGFVGYGGGSSEDAAEIKAGVRRVDVFVSASASADALLEGKNNGDWVSWYATFAAAPLVLGYDPRSKVGSELRHGKPWYEVLTQPGVLVGRTDPKLDPKGVLTVEALDNAAAKLHDSALRRALSSFAVYPETALVGRLQSGQLEAGFFYTVEAASAHLATVSLKPVFKYALYTVTILRGAADPAGGAQLVRYLLSYARGGTRNHGGLEGRRPKFSGVAAAVPRSLRALVGAH